LWSSHGRGRRMQPTNAGYAHRNSYRQGSTKA
jgi:hypothetical protein